MQGGLLSSYTYYYEGFRSQNPVAPTQYGASFGSSPWPAIPSSTPSYQFMQRAYWLNRSAPSSTSGTLNVGIFSPSITYGSTFSYLQIIKSGTTTNIPYATFTPNGSPGTPPASLWSGSMPITASQFPTHIIFNGQSVTLALF